MRAFPRFACALLSLALFIGAATVTDASAPSILSGIQERGDAGSATVTFTFVGPVPYGTINQSDPSACTVVLASTTPAAGLSNSRPASSIKKIETLRNGPNLDVQITLSNSGICQLAMVGSTLVAQISLDKASMSTDTTTRDTTPTAASGQVSVLVRLKHVDPLELDGLFGSGAAGAQENIQPSALLQQSSAGSYYGGVSIPQTGFSGGQQIPAGANPVSATRLNDHVVFDRRLNALLITGTPAEVDEIKKQIALIDVADAPTASVLLQAQIVELSETASRHVGLDLTNNGALGSANLEATNGGTPQASLSLQAQIFAQISKGQGSLIASPRVQTVAGTGASILTGDALPILTTITYPGTPPVIQQQLQYVNVGVQLQIVPHVTADGFISSRIIAEVSNVTSLTNGNIPTISQRQAVATARVRDGEPFVIGGLLQDNDIQAMSKIPLLGDLPIIGSLFRLHSTLREKTNLYIIVTPHIVRDSTSSR